MRDTSVTQYGFLQLFCCFAVVWPQIVSRHVTGCFIKGGLESDLSIDFGILCLFSGDSCLVGCQKFWEVN